ncbi:MAG TPA: anthranilate phosphoribosyltransferase [Mycobacteriales bacterium]|nr:anthranilate phosphoribosyltransferase [Mycobacteriales bacterium]
MAGPTWPGLLTVLLGGDALSAAEAAWAMGEVMTGTATSAQVAAFAVALRAKGETAAEVSGLVATMLEHAHRIRVVGPAVDTCGTGGDRSHSVNISTMAALVVRGAGTTVVKHGNRAASSSCGSADVLERLGVVVDLAPAQVERCVAELGIGFCFAPVFHPALRHTAAARRELGIATVFNFLGPLTNPAQPPAQALGVADIRMAPVLAGVLADRGTSALVFRGDDGLDELTTTTTSTVWLVRDREVTRSSLDPADLGLAAAHRDQLRGGDPLRNAAVVRELLAGAPGPVRDAVLLNAAAALLASEGPDPGRPLAEQLTDHLARAAVSIDSGAAAQVLRGWAALSQQLRE